MSDTTNQPPITSSLVVKENKPNSFLKYTGLGLQLFFTIGVSAWIGFKIDAWLKLKFPIFLLVFVLFSFAGMIYRIYRTLNE